MEELPKQDPDVVYVRLRFLVNLEIQFDLHRSINIKTLNIYL